MDAASHLYMSPPWKRTVGIVLRHNSRKPKSFVANNLRKNPSATFLKTSRSPSAQVFRGRAAVFQRSSCHTPCAVIHGLHHSSHVGWTILSVLVRHVSNSRSSIVSGECSPISGARIQKLPPTHPEKFFPVRLRLYCNLLARA